MTALASKSGCTVPASAQAICQGTFDNDDHNDGREKLSTDSAMVNSLGLSPPFKWNDLTWRAHGLQRWKRWTVGFAGWVTPSRHLAFAWGETEIQDTRGARLKRWTHTERVRYWLVI